jgi:hypothetical protein
MFLFITQKNLERNILTLGGEFMGGFFLKTFSIFPIYYKNEFVKSMRIFFTKMEE